MGFRRPLDYLTINPNLVNLLGFRGIPRFNVAVWMLVPVKGCTETSLKSSCMNHTGKAWVLEYLGGLCCGWCSKSVALL